MLQLRGLPGFRGSALPTLLSAWLLASIGCQPAAEEPVEIRIGVILPFSGSLAERIGSYVQEGVRLAVDQAEARGGVVLDGRRMRIVVVFEDSRDRPESAVEAARKLIDQDQVAALIGPCLSRNALAVAAFADRKRMPMISPTSTHPELTAGKPFVFRATIVDDFQARALARYTREDLKARTAAVLYDVASAYNRNIAELFRQAFTAGGGRMVAFESYTTGAHDFRIPLIRIREAAPDVLLLPNYVDEVPMQARQARELGLESIFIGSDAWDAEIYPSQEVFEGSFFADDWLPEITGEVSAEEKVFLKEYNRRFGRPPNSPAALAYDAMGLLISAIDHSGSLDGEAIRQAITDVEAYRGATGILAFRGGGDPDKTTSIFAIRGGEVDFIKRIRP